MIPLSEIHPDPDQPRKTFHPDSIASLSGSIQKHGVIQPLIVRRDVDGFVILAGERRYRAALDAGIEEVPAVLREDAGLSAFEIALVENLQREDLNPIDEAEAYRRLTREAGLTQDQVAVLGGRSRAHVANTVRLLKLLPETKNALQKQEITAGHARALLMVRDDGQQRFLLEQILQDGWSVRRAEREARLRATRRKSTPRKSPALTPYYDGVTRQLSDHLGTQVHVRSRGTRGTIEISFQSLGELRSVMCSLGVPEPSLGDEHLESGDGQEDQV